jgi:hypothetical protein
MALLYGKAQPTVHFRGCNERGHKMAARQEVRLKEQQAAEVFSIGGRYAIAVPTGRIIDAEAAKVQCYSR